MKFRQAIKLQEKLSDSFNTEYLSSDQTSSITFNLFEGKIEINDVDSTIVLSIEEIKELQKHLNTRI